VTIPRFVLNSELPTVGVRFTNTNSGTVLPSTLDLTSKALPTLEKFKPLVKANPCTNSQTEVAKPQQENPESPSTEADPNKIVPKKSSSQSVIHESISEETPMTSRSTSRAIDYRVDPEERELDLNYPTDYQDEDEEALHYFHQILEADNSDTGIRTQNEVVNC